MPGLFTELGLTGRLVPRGAEHILERERLRTERFLAGRSRGRDDFRTRCPGGAARRGAQDDTAPQGVRRVDPAYHQPVTVTRDQGVRHPHLPYLVVLPDRARGSL